MTGSELMWPPRLTDYQLWFWVPWLILYQLLTAAFHWAERKEPFDKKPAVVRCLISVVLHGGAMVFAFAVVCSWPVWVFIFVIALLCLLAVVIVEGVKSVWRQFRSTS